MEVRTNLLLVWSRVKVSVGGLTSLKMGSFIGFMLDNVVYVRPGQADVQAKSLRKFGLLVLKWHHQICDMCMIGFGASDPRQASNGEQILTSIPYYPMQLVIILVIMEQIFHYNSLTLCLCFSQDQTNNRDSAAL